MHGSRTERDPLHHGRDCDRFEANIASHLVVAFGLPVFDHGVVDEVEASTRKVPVPQAGSMIWTK